MPKIEIVNRQSKFRINRKDIIRAVELVLGSVRRKSAGVNVVFIDNKTIKKLNRQFLRHDYITDVIAFPFDDGGLLGDVVVSVERASDEARRRGITTREEILRYVVHGVLHLVGYRDKRPSDKKRMWARQEEIVEKIKSKSAKL
ncbi:MAG: rRNA maturation RNase YbeY [Planctomycetes bacterium RBG_16_43_13]|nr:MAG: rRNA maturation RNase YbeY [Planctomycetes bacterium RBG_16_43_13]